MHTSDDNNIVYNNHYGDIYRLDGNRDSERMGKTKNE